MSGGGAERIEGVVDAAAAALFAAAAGYCGVRVSSSLALTGALAAVALCCSFALLRAVRPEDRHFRIQGFAPAESAIGAVEPASGDDEQTGLAPSAPELLLDDVLAELAPDSRVVRLFDPAAMPTPGELRARIDRHLGGARIAAASPHAPEADASQALHEALAELRRSLR